MKRYIARAAAPAMPGNVVPGNECIRLFDVKSWARGGGGPGRGWGGRGGGFILLLSCCQAGMGHRVAASQRRTASHRGAPISASYVWRRERGSERGLDAAQGTAPRRSGQDTRGWADVTMPGILDIARRKWFSVISDPAAQRRTHAKKDAFLCHRRSAITHSLVFHKTWPPRCFCPSVRLDCTATLRLLTLKPKPSFPTLKKKGGEGGGGESVPNRITPSGLLRPACTRCRNRI